jgi:hypothetical protein
MGNEFMRLAVATAAIAALLVASASGGATAKPAIRLVQASPVAIAGTGFGASRRVTVSYESRTSVVRTTRAGTFRATFATAFNRCKGALLKARSTVGSVTVDILPCSSPGGKPTIQFDYGIVSSVQGSAFVPFEHVEVEAEAGDASASGSGRADASGHFRLGVQLAQVRCAEVFVRATGSLGSSATFTRPAPACANP